jgi:hypothetical protein
MRFSITGLDSRSRHKFNDESGMSDVAAQDIPDASAQPAVRRIGIHLRVP